MSDDSTITSVSLGRGHLPAPASAVDQIVLLAVSDEPSLPSSRHVLDGLDEVRFGRGARAATRTAAGGRRILTVRVPDRRMSTEHGRLTRGRDGWVLDDPHSKNGAVVDGRLTRRAALRDGAVFELGHTFFRFDRAPLAEGAGADLGEHELSPPLALATFVGPLADRFAALARIAATPVTVLLLGETGTGKEVVARALHELSGRAGAFVAVNCGALPATLIESELFGHRKGAFSGAVGDRVGLVRTADGGTLLLDEVGELPPASQLAFLRVLQEREVVPVGHDRPIKVDVRLCAATLRDLDALVAAGRFRQDLYARLFGVTVELPPLRERRADLGMLTRALLARTPGGEGATFTPAAMRALLRHDWPLNIRELEKALTGAVALAGGHPIEPRHLPDALRREPARATPTAASAASAAPAAPAAAAEAAGPPALDPDDAALREQLIALCTAHQGNVVAIAESLGKRRMQVYRWARRFGIDLDAYRR